jgi:hypothetical protein
LTENLYCSKTSHDLGLSANTSFIVERYVFKIGVLPKAEKLEWRIIQRHGLYKKLCVNLRKNIMYVMFSTQVLRLIHYIFVFPQIYV